MSDEASMPPRDDTDEADHTNDDSVPTDGHLAEEEVEYVEEEVIVEEVVYEEVVEDDAEASAAAASDAVAAASDAPGSAVADTSQAAPADAAGSNSAADADASTPAEDAKPELPPIDPDHFVGDPPPTQVVEGFEAANSTARPDAPIALGPTISSSGVRRPLPRRRGGGNDALKSTSVPIFITVGLLLLIPAGWALMTLMGHETINSEREDSETMAKIMLVCWPISFTLLSAAVVFMVQLQKNKREEARLNEGQPGQPPRRR